MTNQLMPLNEHRLEQCVLWLSQKHQRPLTQYQVVKLHVMTDVFHVLEFGQPMIGGAITRWKLGPVVPRAYNRIRHLGYRYEKGQDTTPFAVSRPDPGQDIYAYSAAPGVTVGDDEFSEAEIRSMEEAWKTVGELSYTESQYFFHLPERSFMGEAWASAESENAPIDWNVILDAYDRWNGTDHSHVKKIIACGV